MRLNARRHQPIVAKIYLDGEDVTSLCDEVDTVEGWIAYCNEKRYGKIHVVFSEEAQSMFDIGGIIDD